TRSSRALLILTRPPHKRKAIPARDGLFAFRNHRSEFDCRHLLRSRTGGKEGVVGLESRHARPDAVGELEDKGVVVLDRVVVAFARHCNAIFGPSQLILQTHELLARTQLRVVFRKRQQASQRRVELSVGGDLCLRTLRVEQAGPGIRDVAENRALFLREALHSFHEVRDQIRASLQLHIHLRPGGLDALVFGHHLVLRAYIAAEDQKHYQEQHAHDRQRNSKSTTHTVHFSFGLRTAEGPSKNREDYQLPPAPPPPKLPPPNPPKPPPESPPPPPPPQPPRARPVSRPSAWPPPPRCRPSSRSAWPTSPSGPN